MADYRKPDGSTHRCSVPGCNERKTFKIAKSMGRSPLFICRACMAHIAGTFAKLFPEEFAEKFASQAENELRAQVSELQAQLEEANAQLAQASPKSGTNDGPTTAGVVQDGVGGEGANKDDTSSTTDEDVGGPPSPTGEGLDEESLKALKREELNVLLSERGLDPKDYANRGECMAALLGKAE